MARSAKLSNLKLRLCYQFHIKTPSQRIPHLLPRSQKRIHPIPTRPTRPRHLRLPSPVSVASYRLIPNHLLVPQKGPAPIVTDCSPQLTFPNFRIGCQPSGIEHSLEEFWTATVGTRRPSRRTSGAGWLWQSPGTGPAFPNLFTPPFTDGFVRFLFLVFSFHLSAILRDVRFLR